MGEKADGFLCCYCEMISGNRTVYLDTTYFD